MKDFEAFFSNMQMKENDETTPCSIDMNCDTSFPHEKHVFAKTCSVYQHWCVIQSVIIARTDNFLTNRKQVPG